MLGKQHVKQLTKSQQDTLTNEIRNNPLAFDVAVAAFSAVERYSRERDTAVHVDRLGREIGELGHLLQRHEAQDITVDPSYNAMASPVGHV
jgi:hypothetical protein